MKVFITVNCAENGNSVKLSANLAKQFCVQQKEKKIDEKM